MRNLFQSEVNRISIWVGFFKAALELWDSALVIDYLASYLTLKTPAISER